MFDERLKMFEGNCRLSALGCRPAAALRTSSISHPRSHIQGMTLIELLVVIVILTTLVGGVIPILSPNNDVRKIRAAARGLQQYVNLIQARAARTGRPHGIAFRESSAESGVALEVFGLEVPPPFAGFSSASYARVIREEIPNTPQNIVRFYVQFVLADSKTLIPPSEFPTVEDYTNDPVPPKFMQINDEVRVAGTTYRVIDLDFDGDNSEDPLANGPFYTLTSTTGHKLSSYLVEPVNPTGQTLAFVNTFSFNGNGYSFTAPKQYQVIRQPTNSSEAPYQLPAGIGIDFQGSVVENGVFTRPAPVSPSPLPGYANQPLFPGSLSDKNLENVDTVGIMFSPTGAVNAIYHNAFRVESGSRLLLLLGRTENTNVAYEINNSGELTNADWTIAENAPKDELEKKQEEINWLNLDSRLLSIVTSNGRAVVSETAFVDPRIFGAGTPEEQADAQIEAAHEFAHEMSTAN